MPPLVTINALPISPLVPSSLSLPSSLNTQFARVEIIQAPKVNAIGELRVAVAMSGVRLGGGLTIALPDSILKTSGVEKLQVTQVNGAALPVGVRYDEETNSIKISADFIGQLPMKLLVVAGSLKTQVEILEKESATN